ncbi:hypothetical protein H4219_003957 [Mycoemilia scoparia]|uniref:Poly(A) RNA polymerase mitochondrial-like central palm domain-containing protein n=1 Tax=Mycoemilia scoparia TaxID=417184 RepID=A0A9W7ZZS4_9FUNG|nr:hypothetical protein H4219_003957 [Mycoemilia scoparia]
MVQIRFPEYNELEKTAKKIENGVFSKPKLITQLIDFLSKNDPKSSSTPSALDSDTTIDINTDTDSHTDNGIDPQKDTKTELQDSKPQPLTYKWYSLKEVVDNIDFLQTDLLTKTYKKPQKNRVYKNAFNNWIHGVYLQPWFILRPRTIELFEEEATSNERPSDDKDEQKASEGTDTDADTFDTGTLETTGDAGILDTTDDTGNLDTTDDADVTEDCETKGVEETEQTPEAPNKKDKKIKPETPKKNINDSLDSWLIKYTGVPFDIESLKTKNLAALFPDFYITSTNAGAGQQQTKIHDVKDKEFFKRVKSYMNINMPLLQKNSKVFCRKINRFAQLAAGTQYSAITKIFGSTTNQLALDCSDVDLCVYLTMKDQDEDAEVDAREFVTQLGDILIKSDEFKFVEVVPHSRIPIIRLIDPELDIKGDITINNPLGVLCGEILGDFHILDSRPD